ncbi:MAG: MFS transporter [Candidatus Limnocylindria bacterium]|nr:MFS transporter [Candidatus Limnocylindria bacterium]
MRAPRLLAPLAHRDFRLLWMGQTVSQLGNFVHSVALPFQILALGGTPLQLGIGFAISTAAQLLFLLFGGAIVDRIPRRRAILANDLLAGIVMSLVAALGVSGTLRIEHLYVASAILGAAFAFLTPAMGAIIPELVPADVLVAGNALRGMSRQLARVGGPVIGGVVVAVAGPPIAFALDALTFFVSFALLAAARPRAVAPVERRHLLREIREGLDFTFSLPWLWITIFLFALVNVATFGPLVIALPILVRDVLLAGAATYGLISAAVGAGELAGGVLTGQLRVRRSGIVMYGWAIVSGLAIAAMGLAPSLAPILVAAVALGAGFSGFGVLWETALQRHVPRQLLGRVVAVDNFGAILLGPVAPLAFGGLVEQVGPAPMFVASGLASVVLCLAALLVPSIRRLD